MLNSDGYWSAVPQSGGSSCASTLPFVCKKSFEPIPTTPEVTEGQCDPGFLAYADHCYYIEVS